MDQGPSLADVPVVGGANNSPSPAPGVSVETLLDNTVKLTLARSESTIAGHVIISFAKPGPLTCSDLLQCKTTFELLSRAEIEGVTLDEPSLLATVDDAGVARTVYLTPKPNENFRDFAVWVGMVTETVAHLKAKQVGFYLCKESLSPDRLSELAGQVVRSLVEARVVQDICLVVGRHAYNEVLSTALTLKQELDTSQFSVHVLH